MSSGLAIRSMRVVDSHTGGEPTRIIYEGGPDLGSGPLKSRLERFRTEFDCVRSGIVCEPRGNEVVVGGLICSPEDTSCTAGIIFFNNQGYLGMCGHGLIGLMVTLKHISRISSGTHRIETPVGIVTSKLSESGEVDFENVPSYRYKSGVTIMLSEYGAVKGDIAWGGNWFFLITTMERPADFENIPALTRYALAVRQELERSRITGAEGAPIDHIELFTQPVNPLNSSRNFVLCPGGAYDRSPCGTGTSAKLACLAADGKLLPGEIWRQESIVGSVFSASYRTAEVGERYSCAPDTPTIVPTVSGQAFICAESNLIFDPLDPFAYGIAS